MSEFNLEFNVNENKNNNNNTSNAVVESTILTENIENIKSDFDILSIEEKEAILNFVDKIDLSDTANVTSYGKSSQSKISDFSAHILNEVKLKDTGEVGKTLVKLMGEINSLDDKETSGFMKLFKKTKNDVNSLLQNFSTAEGTISDISNTLDLQKIELLKDIEVLDDMYENNKEYFKELNLYIIAGEKKLEKYNNIDIENKKQIVEKKDNQL